MRGIRYEETEAKSVLNRVRGMGFAWSVNPYRGCVHGCHYCFARRYHTYLDLTPGDDFSRVIFVKINAPAVLGAELARPSWRREPVALGTATDPYQPVEGRYRLTRGCLAALADSATPVSLVTKGTMVVRDRDVLRSAGTRGGATVCVSLTTLDPELWRRLEPGTPPPAQRLRAVAALARDGIAVGVLLAPVIPGLTATRDNLEAVIRASADHGAGFVSARVLHLEPGVKEHFTAFLDAEAPHLRDLYARLYPGAYPSAGLQASVERAVSELRDRVGLAARTRPVSPPPGPSAPAGRVVREPSAPPGSAQLDLPWSR
jgi:DNA repair photolyase